MSDVEHYPDGNPKTQFGVVKTPFHLVPPESMAQEAWAFADGATKYGPYNWREAGVSASVYYAAALRHFAAYWNGEDRDPKSGCLHLAHAKACIAIILDAAAYGTLNDDRPPAMPSLGQG